MNEGPNIVNCVKWLFFRQVYGRQCYPQRQVLDSLLLTDINYLDIDMKNIIHRFGENIELGGVANNKENTSPLQQSMEKVADKVQWIVV